MSQNKLNTKPSLELILTEDELAAWVQDFVKNNSFKTLALVGPMGAGKTTLVRYLTQALQVDSSELVSSPTFSILQDYETKTGTIHHFDLYRLNSFADFEELDFLSVLDEDNGINVIEWADKFDDILNLSDVVIKLDYCDDDSKRSLQVWQS